MASKKPSCKGCGHLPGISKAPQSFLNINGYCGWCIEEGIKSDEDKQKRWERDRQEAIADQNRRAMALNEEL